MVKVSVIIPNYNRAAIVGETIENMLHQSLAPYEVIVVDDGSTDDSVEVVRTFGNRVQLIQQANQGPGAARNAGLKTASGQFIQFMDSDDLVSLNKLEAQAQVLLENDADIVYSPWAKVFLGKSTLALQDTVLQQQALPMNATPLQHFLTGWSVVLQQCLLSAYFLKKVGFYRTDIRAWEDGDLFLRMLLAKPKMAFSDASLTLYRLDDYGKLTGTGITDADRAEDCGRFLVSAYQRVKHQADNPLLSRHPKFLATIWKNVSLIESSPSSDRVLINQLREILQDQKRRSPFGAYARFFEILSGVQQRLKGHRWPIAYQPAPLTTHQRALIAELGFRIASQ